MVLLVLSDILPFGSLCTKPKIKVDHIQNESAKIEYKDFIMYLVIIKEIWPEAFVVNLLSTNRIY